VNPQGDFVNPRTFEIAACRGFQLVDFRSDLPELFKIGEEIITFKTLEDLREKARYYLKHPEKRRKIASKAQERVLKDHTYEMRMMELLSFIWKRDERIRERKASNAKVKDLVEKAGRETELGKFLSRFEGKDGLTLQDVTKEIRKGEGDLSQVEGIFLLMKEIWDWAKEKRVI
jgi:spore maturation protein CgeB